jgi:hypothetical protein
LSVSVLGEHAAAAIAPATKPQPDGTLVKALARAWRWQRMLDEGVYATVSEIGDAENILEELRRILRSALLARDVVEGRSSRGEEQRECLAHEPAKRTGCKRRMAFASSIY